MNIDIGIGYGKVLFGMYKEQVIDILGNPDKIINVREDGFEFIYNSLKIKLFFDNEENDRLYSIEIFDKNDTLMSSKIIGMPFKEFICFMKEKGYDHYELDDYDYFTTLYFEECNITFTVEFDEISSFEFSPLFEKDDNTIIWSNNKELSPLR